MSSMLCELYLNKSVLKILVPVPHPRAPTPGGSSGPRRQVSKAPGTVGRLGAPGAGLFWSGCLCGRPYPPAGNLFPPLSSRAGRAPFVLGRFFWPSFRWSLFGGCMTPPGMGVSSRPARRSLEGEAWVCRQRRVQGQSCEQGNRTDVGGL